ncbi:MAG: division/cell wall cluster transcriptional repressor MraZ [Cyclobacteriaceae bacterium]
MSYFSGEYECKVDAKGRMVFPSKFKSRLPESSANEIVVSRGFEKCLVIYPIVEWKKIYSKVIGLNEFNEEYRNFQRNFFRGNTEIELDTNGRLLLPKRMLLYSNIEKEMVAVGIGNRIELWNPEIYEEYLVKDQQEFSQLAQKFLSDE